MGEKKQYCGHTEHDCIWPNCYCAEAEVDRLRATLSQIADPLTIKIPGIGTERALKTIATLQQIAKAALKSQHIA